MNAVPPTSRWRPEVMHRERMIAAFFFPDALTAMTEHDRRAAFRRLRKHGVTSIVTESDTYDDDVIAQAQEQGLRFWAGMACFLDPGAGDGAPPVLATGAEKPQMEWYRGRVPSDAAHIQRRIDTAARIVDDHLVDGLLLDFIRWPLHWELELRPGWPPPLDSSFDPGTLADFERHTGMTLPSHAAADAATWIHTQAPEAWLDYKAAVVADVVARLRDRITGVRDRSFPLAMTTVPMAAEWVGQRYGQLEPHIDAFLPMLYHSILRRSPRWVGAEVAEVRALTTRPVVPILQIDADGSAQGADWGAPVTRDEQQRIIHEAFGAGADGLAIFTGSELLDESRLEVLARALGAADARDPQTETGP